MLVIAMVLQFFTFSAFATDSDSNETFDGYIINAEAIDDSATKYVNAFAFESAESSDSLANIENIRIEVAGNYSVSVNLNIDENISIRSGATFHGSIYALNGNGYFDDKLIVGSFEPTINYSIVLFKILNSDSSPVLNLLVENLETGELTDYSFEVDSKHFDKLMLVAKETTKQLESTKDEKGSITPQVLVAEEVISLMQPGKNYLSAENAGLLRAQSNSSFLSTSSYSATAATASVLGTFCTNMEEASSSGYTPSTTMQSVLSQTGWKMYKTSGHFYVMHGVANTSTEQLVGITYCSLSDERPNDGNQINASFTVAGSVTLSYDKTAKKAYLLQSNTGIRLEDATIAIELVGGTTNFYEATKTFSLEGGKSNFVKDIFIAIASKLGVPSLIWSALKTTNDSSTTVQFGNDANQNNVYDGLIRAASNKTAADRYLWGKKTSLGVIAKYYTTSGKTFSSYRIAYGFTGYSVI